MTTPVQQVSGLVIGSVESVSPNEIRVLLELDAPGATALNTGTPSSFPRLNGYVLIPNEAGGTVGFIGRIHIMDWKKHLYRVGSNEWAGDELPIDPKELEAFEKQCRKHIEPWLVWSFASGLNAACEGSV